MRHDEHDPATPARIWTVTLALVVTAALVALAATVTPPSPAVTDDAATTGTDAEETATIDVSAGGPDDAAGLPAPDDSDDSGTQGHRSTGTDDGQGDHTAAAADDDDAADGGPDPAAADDPCADHAGRDGMDAFIDLAAPVDEQPVDETLELVGCASVYEGTVRYRIVGQDGRVVADSFTTASAGGPEMGEFDTSVDIAGTSGQLTVEVFWDSPADGSEQDTVTVTVERR